MTRVSHFVNYLFFLLYAVIGMELLLELLGASDKAGFKRFMDAVSEPFLGPFHNLIATPARGPHRLRLSYLIAVLAYGMLHLAVTGLLRILARPKRGSY